MADIFDVVADATRRDLLQVLLDRASDSATGEISVGEIVDKLGLSQPTVSKHLKVLRDIGLVSVREEGQHRYYRIDGAPLDALEDWLTPFLGAGDVSTDDGAGSAVFTAWSGTQLPAPLRRAAETLQRAGEAGTAVGRAVAQASHPVRSVIEDASVRVERRVITPLKKRLGRETGPDGE